MRIELFYLLSFYFIPSSIYYNNKLDTSIEELKTDENESTPKLL